MSKSKKNTVDPDEIIETYGADTARWFMLSDLPPERDVDLDRGGRPRARAKFVQRAWRLVGELADAAAAPDAPHPNQFSPAAMESPQGVPCGARQDRRGRIGRLPSMSPSPNSMIWTTVSAIGAIEDPEIAPDLRFAFREARIPAGVFGPR